MLQEHVAGLAAQMGITLSRVSFFDGKLLGCRDCHLVQIYAQGHMESAVVFQQDLDCLQKGITSKRLESRLSTALSRLQTKLALHT